MDKVHKKCFESLYTFCGNFELTIERKWCIMKTSTESAQKIKGDFDMGFGAKLRELRGSKTKKEVANAIDVTYSSYSKYEREERIPRDEVKIRIAAYFYIFQE